MNNFEELKGKTLTKIEVCQKGYSADDSKNCIYFHTELGEVYILWHRQICCESVHIESIVGDITDLYGHPILVAEESKNSNVTGDGFEGTHTWTFYKLATIKGYVDIRWYGESNGYYSEEAGHDPQRGRGKGQRICSSRGH